MTDKSIPFFLLALKHGSLYFVRFAVINLETFPWNSYFCSRNQFIALTFYMSKVNVFNLYTLTPSR